MIQWTTEFVLVLFVTSILFTIIGYLLANAVLGRKVTLAVMQQQQNQQALDTANSYIEEQQSILKQRETVLHQLELEESRRMEQLNTAQSTEQRLINETLEHKNEITTLRLQLDAIRKSLHDVEKKNEAFLSDNRSLDQQVKELKDRLLISEQGYLKERTMTSSLKESLAQEIEKTKSAESLEKNAWNQVQEHKTSLIQATGKYEALQRDFSELQGQHTKLETEQLEREASHARELSHFEQQKASLVEQFKVLSSEILDAKTKSLQESSKQTLSTAMAPFQQSLDSFKKEVQEIHHRETTQQGELRMELESLKALNQKITTEAHELSTALRGQKKLQGNWGEMVLENVLDRSGLQLGKDYKREVNFNTEEGRQRPDAVVYLPQGKHLIIDAKVSLNAYTRYVNAEDNTERTQALKEHVQAVGSRIRELSERDYYKLPGINSPEIVFMFIPIESAFVEALKADETLFQQAIVHNVLVATPTTLLTSLNIVRQLWRYEDQNKHTAALASKAESVFKKLGSFLGSFEKIKKGLDNATGAYITAENQLTSGKGNLVKQVGEFKNLAPAIKSELPEYFTDKAALEIEFFHDDETEMERFIQKNNDVGTHEVAINITD